MKAFHLSQQWDAHAICFSVRPRLGPNPSCGRTLLCLFFNICTVLGRNFFHDMKMKRCEFWILARKIGLKLLWTNENRVCLSLQKPLRPTCVLIGQFSKARISLAVGNFCKIWFLFWSKNSVKLHRTYHNKAFWRGFFFVYFFSHIFCLSHKPNQFALNGRVCFVFKSKFLRGVIFWVVV